MYMATKAELEPIRPLSKFLCIKMVIFASYWQGVAIGLLVHLGIIHTGEWTTYSNPKDIGAGLQDFLICIEMFVAALAHAYAFPPRDYMDMNTWHGPGFTGNLRRMFDVRDVVDDTTLVANDLVSSTAQGITNVCCGVVLASLRVLFRPCNHDAQPMHYHIRLDGTRSRRRATRLWTSPDQC